MLSVHFERDRKLHLDMPIRVAEGRGHINFKVHHRLFLPEGVAALNSAVEQLLSGGQWFQLWKGEVVSIHSPQIGEFDAGLHRGPLVDETTRPRHW